MKRLKCKSPCPQFSYIININNINNTNNINNINNNMTIASKGNTVEVTAPATLSEGLEFEAVHEGKTFTVVVPPGGVKEGQIFGAPLPEDAKTPVLVQAEAVSAAPAAPKPANVAATETTTTTTDPITTSNVPAGAAPGGHWGKENFTGNQTMMIAFLGCLLCGPFACLVLLCPQDNRFVYKDPRGRTYDAAGVLVDGGTGFNAFPPSAVPMQR